MNHQLAHRIAAFGNDRADLEEWTEILSAINQSTDPAHLCSLVLLNFEFFTLPILERLLDVDDDTTEVLLALALFHFHNGQDEQALDLLQRAKAAEPYRLSILQAEIFLHCAMGLEELPQLCNDALIFHPNNEWLRDAAELSAKGRLGPNIVLPPLSIYTR